MCRKLLICFCYYFERCRDKLSHGSVQAATEPSLPPTRAIGGALWWIASAVGERPFGRRTRVRHAVPSRRRKLRGGGGDRDRGGGNAVRRSSKSMKR